MLDPAHLLFPNDAPKAEAAPLPAETKPATTPGDLVQQPTAGSIAAQQDAAATLFKADARQFDAAPVEEIFNGFADAAISDSDGGERFRALETARDGLIADAASHGANAADLAEAMSIVKERQGDGLLEPTPEQAEARMSESLAALRAEGVTDADLAAARRLVADMDKVAPGTIASLERSGAGNDPRLVRLMIKEARRRYG